VHINKFLKRGKIEELSLLKVLFGHELKKSLKHDNLHEERMNFLVAFSEKEGRA
jgi:hypothetical protein